MDYSGKKSGVPAEVVLSQKGYNHRNSWVKLVLKI